MMQGIYLDKLKDLHIVMPDRFYWIYIIEIETSRLFCTVVAVNVLLQGMRAYYYWKLWRGEGLSRQFQAKAMHEFTAPPPHCRNSFLWSNLLTTMTQNGLRACTAIPLTASNLDECIHGYSFKLGIRWGSITQVKVFLWVFILFEQKKL